jgi:hypothetical protein
MTAMAMAAVAVSNGNDDYDVTTNYIVKIV